MIENKQTRQGATRRGAMKRAVAVIMVLLGVLIFAQAISAAQGDEPSTPTTQSTPDAYDAPTEAELLAMPATIDRYLAAHTIPNGAIAAANLDGSTKTASKNKVAPGETFQYTITVDNSGGVAIPVAVTDVLPAEVTYYSHQCPPLITTSCGYSAGTVSWEGTAEAGESVEISITVILNVDVAIGTVVTNTAQLVSAEQELEVNADVTATKLASSPIQFLPYTTYGLMPEPGPVTLTGGQVNSANSWNLSWTTSPGSTGYEIQEAKEPNFAAVTPIIVEETASLTIKRAPSPNNVYYYRARSLVGQFGGPWSNVVTVVGGYWDDFEDPSTGWAVRRGTHPADLRGIYQGGDFVTKVKSRWDWLIASPLRPTPRVPYVIDFDAVIVGNDGGPGFSNSAGGVFGGDWNGQECPPDTTSDEVFMKQTNCFNHFYNANGIYENANLNAVKMLMVFERVDQLKYVPQEGGSPLKRYGDIPLNAIVYKKIDPKGWNHYRFEVRADSIRVYAGKYGEELKLQYQYHDTRWINSPYFGFFTSTDFIEDSIWHLDNYSVMPLDN